MITLLMNNYPLRPSLQLAFFTVALLLVAFGQPVWNWWLPLLSSSFGFTLILRVILAQTKGSSRFWVGTGWMAGVQLIQLFWLTSHPYLYIYGVWAALALLVGVQFGVLSRLVTVRRLSSIQGILFIAAVWTLMEWMRLFILSGVSWNPVGLALSANLFSLQFANIWGIFGLSFWVMFVNLLGLKMWLDSFRWQPILGWALALIFPYLYGFAHLQSHDAAFQNQTSTLKAALVQTAFPSEEALSFPDARSVIAYVEDEWKSILTITKKHYGEELDLVVLPEMVVPFGAHSFIFPSEDVMTLFSEVYGEQVLPNLPPLEPPLAKQIEQGKWIVSNAYWAQSLANVYNAPLLIGFEDAADVEGERQYYSAANYFYPRKSPKDYVPTRYEKRILVPMGEYLPFEFVKTLAAKYGVSASMTPGKEAKVFHANGCPFSPSICYEETFSDLMRESRQKGAELLVNLTSDVWYPNSHLPKQHFDHSRLRTVESGIPLIRACNTGVTGAVDCFGRDVALLGEGDHSESEWTADSIKVEVPLYHYNTLYSQLGDGFIIGLSLLISLLFFRTQHRNVDKIGRGK